MLFVASWATLFLYFTKCLAGSGGTAFLGPTGITGNNVELEQTWFIGDEKDFTWNGTWVAADLQYQATDSLVAVTIGSYITNHSLTWNVDVSESQSPTHSQYFFFYLAESSNPKNNVISNLIRVVQDPGAPTFTTMSSATTSNQATTTEFATEVVTLTDSVFSTVTSTAVKANSTLMLATTVSTISTTTAPNSGSLTIRASTPAIPQTTTTNGPVVTYSSFNTGEKIALGVAIPFGVIALVGLGAFAWWYRTRRRSRRPNLDATLARKPSTLHDMYKSELDAGAPMSEMADDEYNDNGVKKAKRGVSEMSGLSRPSEMEAMERDSMMIHELPNSEVGDLERRSLMSGGPVSPPTSPRTLMSGSTMSPPLSPRTEVSRDSRG